MSCVNGPKTVDSSDNTEQKDVGVVLPPDVDAHILPLLRRVNHHPSFQTVGSCGGHYHICADRVAQRKRERRDSVPSIGSSSHRQRRTEAEMTSMLCDVGGNFPDLIFCVSRPEDPDMLRLLTLLRTAPKGTDYALTQHREHPDTYTFHYSAEHGCEAFWPSEREELESRPRFREFWHFFAECWNHAVHDAKLHLLAHDIPLQFDQDPRRWRRCQRYCTSQDELPWATGTTREESAMVRADLFLADTDSDTTMALFEHSMARDARRATAQEPDEGWGWVDRLSGTSAVAVAATS